MTRSLNAAMVTALQAEEGYADLWLLELNTSGGTLRYCDKAWDVAWNSQTWVGLGGVFTFGPPPETTDLSAQSMRFVASGVDTSIIAAILTDDVRGRAVNVWWGQINEATGVVVTDPIQMFGGLLNDDWRIQHVDDGTSAPTATVETVFSTRVARGLPGRHVRTNPTSHDSMLDRAGLTTGDRLFEFVSGLASRTVIWGPQNQRVPIDIPDDKERDGEPLR